MRYVRGIYHPLVLVSQDGSETREKKGGRKQSIRARTKAGVVVSSEGGDLKGSRGLTQRRHTGPPSRTRPSARSRSTSCSRCSAGRQRRRPPSACSAAYAASSASRAGWTGASSDRCRRASALAPRPNPDPSRRSQIRCFP